MKYLYVLLAFSFLFSCKDENKKTCGICFEGMDE